jgi:hypothetical protein
MARQIEVSKKNAKKRSALAVEFSRQQELEESGPNLVA